MASDAESGAAGEHGANACAIAWLRKLCDAMIAGGSVDPALNGDGKLDVLSLNVFTVFEGNAGEPVPSVDSELYCNGCR